MFHLIKFIIWLVGLVVVIYFALPFFGYKVNLNYFEESKVVCWQRVADCTKSIATKGKNTNCDLMCLDPQLIFKKNSK